MADGMGIEAGPDGLDRCGWCPGPPEYVEYPDTGESALYDLAGDPHELTNLAGDPATRSVREELRTRLESLRRR